MDTEQKKISKELSEGQDLVFNKLDAFTPAAFKES